jgi:hypothetical protein
MCIDESAESPLIAALHKIRQNNGNALCDRQDRAVEVKETYNIVYAGLQGWVVQHPDELERTYFADMIHRKCTCPDWHCTAQGLGIDCKHILAIIPLWEELTGLKDERAGMQFVVNGVPTNDAGFVPVYEPDSDDPYQD